MNKLRLKKEPTYKHIFHFLYFLWAYPRFKPICFSFPNFEKYYFKVHTVFIRSKQPSTYILNIRLKHIKLHYYHYYYTIINTLG